MKFTKEPGLRTIYVVTYTRYSSKIAGVLLAAIISIALTPALSLANDEQHNMGHSHSDMSMAVETQSHSAMSSGEIFQCPMHPNETSHEPGRCSICGMFLVAKDGNEKEYGHEATDNEMHMSHEMVPAGDKPNLYWDSTEIDRSSVDPEHQHSHHSPLTESHRIEAQSTSSIPASDIDSHADHLHHQHKPTYICPMHPQITSQDADATCPICGMDLVEKTKPKTNLPSVAPGSATTYICPMHPQIVSEDPDATCPICGMDLVEKSSAPSQDENPQVYLDSSVIQNMGVRTFKIKRSSINKSINTQGIITPDDERIRYIHPRTGGWVKRLYHSSEGDRVERKDELMDFYSPWINQAQLDFITALEELDMVSYDPSRKGELEAKADAYRNSLRMLSVSPMDLMRIEKGRKVLNTIEIKAPQGGIITELKINEGSFVEPYESMFTIVDLSEVWVMVDIFEHQAPWVKKGHKVTITTPAIPAREWVGEIEFIYPEVNPKTRTLRARIEIPNPDEALLLNMFVNVDLSGSTTKENVISVPREAIILTGEREVIVKSLGKGHFQPVEVETGLWGDEHVEIVNGVDAGDEIVVSGQFLIDSESNIQSSLLRMME